ncbi:MAG: glycosyltransferase family 2 protein [Hyphomicrobiales bacterium]
MTNRRAIPITVIVPVRNEEANLPRCLVRLDRFSEVIVLDSSSTDRTPEIARHFGARYINFEWDGKFPKKRNWLLIHHELSNAWALFLDADELVDEAFCTAAQEAVNQKRHAGYWLNYDNYFMGRCLRHGVPQRKLALFRVGSGLYEKIDETSWSSLDMEIHEHPIIDGTIGEIAAHIEHNDQRGIVKFIDRHRDYALWEANRTLLFRSKNTSEWKHLSRRQAFKYRHISKWWYPWFYFIFTYVVRIGFLDGGAGFAYAFYKAWYFETIRLLIRERAITNADKTDSLRDRSGWKP